jgi:hypothetical protein
MGDRLRELANSPKTQATLTLFWVVMIPVSIVTGWISSVAYVSALSLWALVASHGAWWAAASVGEEAPEQVVEAIVENTDVEPSP